jgi:hypothetical protein
MGTRFHPGFRHQDSDSLGLAAWTVGMAIPQLAVTSAPLR